jgi:hypothetical protein
MINSALKRQVKSTNELLCRLIEERDGKKLDATSINPSSSTYAVSFAQTNPQTSGVLVGSTSMPNPSAQPVPVNHSIAEPASRIRLLLLGCYNEQ